MGGVGGVGQVATPSFVTDQVKQRWHAEDFLVSEAGLLLEDLDVVLDARGGHFIELGEFVELQHLVNGPLRDTQRLVLAGKARTRECLLTAVALCRSLLEHGKASTGAVDHQNPAALVVSGQELEKLIDVADAQPGCVESKGGLALLGFEEVKHERRFCAPVAHDDATSGIALPIVRIRRNRLQVAHRVDGRATAGVLHGAGPARSDALEDLSAGHAEGLGGADHDSESDGPFRSGDACVARLEEVLGPDVLALEHEDGLFDAGVGHVLDEILNEPRLGVVPGVASGEYPLSKLGVVVRQDGSDTERD